jgi:hypothetical protein
VDLDLLFWLLIVGIAVAWLSRSVPEPSQAFSGIWRYREILWPSGVQEDDDAHWSWAPPWRERPAPPEPATVTEASAAYGAEDPRAGDGSSMPARIHGGRYEVRAAVHAQVRSADRARS